MPRGAYNVAADPVLEGADIAAGLGTRSLALPQGLVRAAAALAYAGRLSPTEPGWLDLGLGVPMLDTGRIRRELGWAPRHDARATLVELLDAMARGRDAPTPPLAAATSGPGRRHEFATGVGARP